MNMPMGSYSLKNIIDRIENNGINSTLSEIENIINTSSIAEEIKKQRNIFFENANIKTKYNQSEFYKMSNYDKFLYIKSNEIQKSLNHMTKSGEEINNISQLPELKKLKKEITKNLAILNKQIYKLEKQYKEMQGQMFEGVLDITDSELEEWIGEKLNPLRQEKFKLKQQSREVKEKIKEAEKNSISIG